MQRTRGSLKGTWPAGKTTFSSYIYYSSDPKLLGCCCCCRFLGRHLRVLVILLLVLLLTLQVQGKGKFVPLRPMKAYGGSRDVASLILNLSNIRRLVVHFTLRPLYRQKTIPVPTVGCADPRTGLDWPKKLLAAIVIRTPDPLVSRESYLLRYPKSILLLLLLLLLSSSSSSSS